MDPALLVAVIALAVAIAAAAFSAWQAVTAHLARTTPRRASFVISRGPHMSSPWVLLNTGGSVAVDVVVTAYYPMARDDKSTVVGKAVGPSHPDQSVSLAGTESRGFGATRIKPNPDEAGAWLVVPDGERGGKYSMKRYATVTWRDHKGRSRRGRIRMR